MADVDLQLHTYLYETTFSSMKITTSECRTTLSTDHLELSFHLAISDYYPDYDHQLTNDTQVYSIIKNKKMLFL